MYPILASYYITEAVGEGLTRGFYSELMVCLMLIMRLGDLNFISRISLVITIISILPTVRAYQPIPIILRCVDALLPDM